MALAKPVSNAYLMDFSQGLALVQKHPQVAEALGANGRILEVVSYEKGLMVRYVLAGQECVGKLNFGQDGTTFFEPKDDRCVAPAMKMAQSQGVISLQSETMLQKDMSGFVRALRYVRAFSHVVKPDIEEILGIRTEDARTVVTYRAQGKSAAEPCWFAMMPTASGGSSMHEWRIMGPPACQTH
ncbi:MAG: hypothetical protein AB7N80_13005 [Bdellovibrionales bacterium]